MKLLICAFSFMAILASGLAQSGRRVKENKPPPPPVEEQIKETPQATKQDETSQVTAEKNQDYKCTDDGTLARVLENEKEPEEIFSAKVVETRPVITTKPKPSYTKEARRNGVQGYVILKVVLTTTGKIGRIRVVRGLPGGLTENAIKAACKIEFKPAMKNGQPVAQWLTVEYAFRLADSSILGP